MPAVLIKDANIVSLTPEQHENLLKGGPSAFGTVDDFGNANPRGHGKFHGRSRQPITLQNENPAGVSTWVCRYRSYLRTN